jgi:hypothetical protein
MNKMRIHDIKKFNYKKRIVAFIDILGFKEHIQSNEKQEELLNILYETKKA